jgi:hypothetical protein
MALQLLPVQYGPDEEDTSAVLITGSEHTPMKVTHSESVMYAVLLGKTLPYSEWVQAGVEAKIGERSAKEAIRKLMQAGRVQKSGKLYSQRAAQEGEDE